MAESSSLSFSASVSVVARAPSLKARATSTACLANCSWSFWPPAVSPASSRVASASTRSPVSLSRAVDTVSNTSSRWSIASEMRVVWSPSLPTSASPFCEMALSIDSKPRATFRGDLFRRLAQPPRRRRALLAERFRQLAAAADDGFLDDAELGVELLAKVTGVVADARRRALGFGGDARHQRVALADDGFVHRLDALAHARREALRFRRQSLDQRAALAGDGFVDARDALVDARREALRFRRQPLGQRAALGPDGFVDRL